MNALARCLVAVFFFFFLPFFTFLALLLVVAWDGDGGVGVVFVVVGGGEWRGGLPLDRDDEDEALDVVDADGVEDACLD